MPFEDLTGNSGFVSDSEGATANLEINMSENSARNLWDVQAAVQQIAVDFQTVVRSAADFNSYLISIRETSQTVKMPALGMEGGAGGNMSYAGGRVDSGSVPLVQSEMGMASRIGEMEENASGAGGGAMSARSGTGTMDVGEFVNQMTNAGWMASMTGGVHTPQETVSAYEQEYQYATSNRRSPQVMSSSFGGQAGTARSFAASRIVGQGLPGAQQFLRGGGAGGMASMLGRLGTYGALGYAGYQLANAGLETYAQSRAMGIAVNNSERGAGWGFGQRLSQSEMAMSPFVSQEDVSQIYNSAIDQGWASRRGDFAQGNFSQAVNFMYGAAKDYNMDPGTSAQLLQDNALGAGQSIASLNQQLFTLKESLDGTGVSMSSATKTFSSFSSFLIGSGASPTDAARIAGGALRSFAGNTNLGPDSSGAMSVLGAMQNPQIQAIVGGLTGNLPGAAFAGANANKGTEALQGVIHSLAVQYSSQTGMSFENRAALFQTAYKQLTGQDIDQRKAASLMTEAAADPNFVTRGQEEFDKASGMTLKTKGGAQAWWSGLDKFFGATHTRNTDPSRSDYDVDSSSINAHRYYSEEVNKLLEGSADQLGNMVLYGPDGKPISANGRNVAGAGIADWFDSEENFNKFNDVKNGYYIMNKNDSSKNKFDAKNIGYGGSNGGAEEGKSEANTVYITLSPQAKMYFDTNVDKLELSTGRD